jgi:hypothetical protein
MTTTTLAAIAAMWVVAKPTDQIIRDRSVS